MSFGQGDALRDGAVDGSGGTDDGNRSLVAFDHDFRTGFDALENRADISHHFRFSYVQHLRLHTCYHSASLFVGFRFQVGQFLLQPQRHGPRLLCPEA